MIGVRREPRRAAVKFTPANRRALKPLLDVVDGVADEQRLRAELRTLVLDHDGVGVPLACQFEVLTSLVLWIDSLRPLRDAQAVRTLAVDLCARRRWHGDLDAEESEMLLNAVVKQSPDDLEFDDPALFILKCAVLINDAVHLVADLTDMTVEEVWVHVEAGGAPGTSSVRLIGVDMDRARFGVWLILGTVIWLVGTIAAAVLLFTSGWKVALAAWAGTFAVNWVLRRVLRAKTPDTLRQL
jgi:hypothetical protein